MDKIEMSKKALKVLVLIVSSCFPLCGKEMEKFKKYVIETAQKNQPVDFKEFANNSPVDAILLDELPQFMKEENVRKIDDDLVLKYFGGKWHIIKTLIDIKEKMPADTNNDFVKQRILFGHILIGVIVEKVDDRKISGNYRLGNISVVVKNLIASDALERNIKAGDTVLAHFAAVVAVNPDKEVLDYILRDQEENREFKSAVKYMSGKGIDYDKFPSLQKI